MKAFTTLSSAAVPLPLENIDTDIIIPAHHLKTVKRSGLGVHGFESLRYDADGAPLADSPFDQPQYKGAEVLVTGANFGCGSSREHAAWAIDDMGIRAIIAPSYSDIFGGNCVKNGILAITLPQETVDLLMDDAKAELPFTIDLDKQVITRANGLGDIPFDYNPVHKHLLLNGLDEIGQTLQSADAIRTFEKQQSQAQPWLYRD